MQRLLASTFVLASTIPTAASMIAVLFVLVLAVSAANAQVIHGCVKSNGTLTVRASCQPTRVT